MEKIDKRGEGSIIFGFLVRWGVIIGLGVVLLLILVSNTRLGNAGMSKIKEIFPFI